jgi:hypothetical protein
MIVWVITPHNLVVSTGVSEELSIFRVEEWVSITVLLFGLLFYIENEGDVFLQSINRLLSINTASQPTKILVFFKRRLLPDSLALKK